MGSKSRAVEAEGGRDEAGERTGSPVVNVRPRGRIRPILLALAATLVSACALATPALAQEHTFETAIPSQEPKCPIEEPGTIAVNNATGEVFLYERAHNYVDEFIGNKCIRHQRPTKGESGEATNEGMAVDNSPTSPSKGDLYLWDAEEKTVSKFAPDSEGKLKIVWRVKTFKNKAEGKEAELHEFEAETYGMDVDANGDLWIYDSENHIWHFSNEEKPQFLGELEVEGVCPAQPGFAVGPHAEYFYVGRERANRLEECNATSPAADTLVKINSVGEPLGPHNEPVEPYRAQVDNQNTTGVALDKATGDLYFDNVTSIAAYDAEGEFLQRFALSEPGALGNGSGLGYNGATGQVYAGDAEKQTLNVYKASTPPPPPPPPVAHTLADGRQYEQVSPSDKRGQNLYGLTLHWGLIQAAASGNSLGYLSTGPVVDAPAGVTSPYPTNDVARRGAKEWNTEAITIPHSPKPTGFFGGEGTYVRQYTPELTSAFIQPHLGNIIEPHEPSLSPEETETTVYTRDTSGAPCPEPPASPCFRPLVSNANAPLAAPFGSKVSFLSATEDGSFAVLRSEAPLAPEAPEAGLYEWSSSSGALQLVSTPPAGEALEAGELFLGAPGEAHGGLTRNAISSDGNRVVFSATGSAPEGSGALYVHDTAKNETVRLDVPQGVTLGEVPEPSARYVDSSNDGGRILFTSAERLTPDSTAEEGVEENGGLGDLYECQVGETAGKLSCTLHDLTAETGGEPARVQGVMGADATMGNVYFVANGALAHTPAGTGNCEIRERTTSKEEREGKLPVEKCNLYRDHFNGETGKWEPTFVATLTTQDEPDWHDVVTEGELGRVTSRVSPDGNYLAFMSSRSLTGYNNTDANPAAKGARDEEVFLYNAGANSISCVSCNPSGVTHGMLIPLATNEGEVTMLDSQTNWQERWVAATIPGWTNRELASAKYQSRYLDNNGRVFFNTPDSIVPADENGKTDVYEFEPHGLGSCADENGCVSLMSSGTSDRESGFLDASETGDDVFFVTAAPLVPATDKDTGLDIYDAHACSEASPCKSPVIEEHTTCEGEACKEPAGSVGALPPAPPSAAAGKGNAGKHSVLPFTETKHTTTVKPLTRAQKLAKALKECRTKKNKKKRKACERAAHKKYGSAKKAAHRASRGRR